MILQYDLSHIRGPLIAKSLESISINYIKIEGNVVEIEINDDIDELAVDAIMADHALLACKYYKIYNFHSEIDRGLLTGFESSALGSPHYYDSSSEDQMNLIAVMAENIDTLFSCASVEGGEKEFKYHTASQIKKLFADGKDVKMQALLLKASISQAINGLSSIQDVNEFTT